MNRAMEIRGYAILIALSAHPFTASIAHAQREKYLPMIVQLPTDARALAMGGAGLALERGESVFSNPALVGTQGPMSLSLARYSSSATSGVFATSTKLGKFGLGFGVQYLDYSRNPASRLVPSRALTDAGIAQASSLAATLAASVTWKSIKWGVGAKYLEERALFVKDGSVAVDLGAARHLPFWNLTAAAAIQNVGPSLSVAGQRYALPARASLGIQGDNYHIGRWIDAGIVAQVSVRRDGVVLPAAGGELTFEPLEGFTFSARAGARRAELKEERPATAGVGVGMDRVNLDYAWEQLRSGGAHRITVRLR